MYNNTFELYPLLDKNDRLTIHKYEEEHLKKFKYIPEKTNFGKKFYYKYNCKKYSKNSIVIYEYCYPIVVEDVLLGFIYISNPLKISIELDELLKEFLYSMLELEKILYKELRELRESYVLESINQLTVKLLDQASKIKISETMNSFYIGRYNMETFWTKVSGVIDDLRSLFFAEHIVIFSTENYHDINLSLKPVISSGLKNDELVNCRFDTSSLIINDHDKTSITSQNHPEILDSLVLKNIEKNPKTDFIRIFKNIFGNKNVFVIWVRYGKDWQRVSEIETHNPYYEEENEIFERGIVSFYSLLSSIYTTLILENYSDILNTNIKVSLHELSQYTAAIDGMRYYFLEQQNIHNDLLKYTHTDNFNKDLHSTIEQMYKFLQNNRSIVKFNKNLEIEEIDPLKDIVMKWAHSLKIKARSKKATIITPDKSGNVKILSDKAKIEQVFFNILNNAIKYSHRGTKITIAQKIIENNLHISISDYGHRVSEKDNDERVYHLFTRGINSYSEGMGIGLYISNLNILSLKGKITYVQNKICDFHVPVLIYLFQNSKDHESFFNKYSTNKDKINEYIDDVVNLHPDGNIVYIPTNNNLIKIPTYKVTFTITIPLNYN